MKKNNGIRRDRHCVFNMHVHLVFAASGGGAPIEIVRQDIEQQQTPSGYEDASASALFISALNGGVFRAI